MTLSVRAAQEVWRALFGAPLLTPLLGVLPVGGSPVLCCIHLSHCCMHTREPFAL